VNKTSYLVLDAARCGIENIEEANELTMGQQGSSLFLLGKGNEHLSVVAPYLFVYETAAIQEWFMSKGWGKSWGWVFVSGLEYQQVFTHLRRFLKVRKESSGNCFFRFYDPRVIRIFLPVCTEDQLNFFFRGIDSFIVEDEDPEYQIIYVNGSGLLEVERKITHVEITGNNG
jgi:hypothetical protein